MQPSQAQIRGLEIYYTSQALLHKVKEVKKKPKIGSLVKQLLKFNIKLVLGLQNAPNRSPKGKILMFHTVSENTALKVL